MKKSCFLSIFAIFVGFIATPLVAMERVRTRSLQYDNLYKAISKEDEKLLLDAIRAGVDINQPSTLIDLAGATPLHYAACLGKEKFVQILLDNGADPEFQDIYGKTPVNYAEIAGHKGVADMILQKTPEEKLITIEQINLENIDSDSSFYGQEYIKEYGELALKKIAQWVALGVALGDHKVRKYYRKYVKPNIASYFQKD